MAATLLYLGVLGWSGRVLSEIVRQPQRAFGSLSPGNISHLNNVEVIEHEAMVAIESRQAACKCGVKGDNRIAGISEDAGRHEYPWMAALCTGGNCEDDGNYFCGASLINTQYFLTAASCLEGKDAADITVAIGNNVLADGNGLETFVGERIVPHPDFVVGQPSNNIALIKVTAEVPLGDTISPVCLAGSMKTYGNKKVYLSSWGGAPDETLKEVDLTVLLNNECKRIYNLESLTNGVFCARKDGSHVCEPDYGSPLVYKHKNGYYEQIGIPFEPADCNDMNVPPRFTAVSRFSRFIRRNTNDVAPCRP